jgi:hypothetical protein
VGLRRIAALAGLGVVAGALLGVGAGDASLGLLRPREVGAIKAAVAVAATLLLAAGAWLDRRGAADRHRRGRDAALACLGLLGAACWWNLFQFNYPGFGHPSDTFHYYLGAKYFPELRYTRLYACVAVADAEAGALGADDARPLRDLETNRLGTSAAALADPEGCTSHFGAGRWQEFRHDVDFLRSQVGVRSWRRFQQDHGYNATPVWSLLGRALTATGPASGAQLAALRALDPVLLALMFAGIAWAFGWRIACIAAIYWGTNYAAPYGWTGGSILRQDWLAATVLGICLLRRERFAGAGALLAIAALLRLVPVFAIAGVALGIGGRLLRERRLSLRPAERRFAAGAIAAGAAALLASAVWMGPAAWSEFAHNSRVHLATPLANHAGLRTILSYDPAMRTELSRDAALEDPMERWKAARSQRSARFAWLHAALAAGFGALIALAGAGRPPWLAAVLGIAWIPIGAELTAYYWSVLLALAFLHERHAWLGAALCGLSALGWWIGHAWHWTDQIHVWLSVATAAFCAAAVLAIALQGEREAATRA